MLTPSPPTPAERFASILLGLSLAVAARNATGLGWPLINLIMGRIRHIKDRFARLAARIREGRYVPRRSAPRAAGVRRPRQPSKLPQEFGWLLKLVPEAIGFYAQLEFLFRDEEMAALLAAAPASLSRPLRSLCWMLRMDPPKILPPPPRPIRRATKPKPERYGPPAPPRTPPRKQWSLTRVLGPRGWR